MIFSFFRRTFATERTRRALRSTFDQIQRPKKTNRTDFFNGKNVIRAIICANGFVFVLWKFSYANLRTNFDDRFLWFMTKNFMVSWTGVVDQKRFWTLLTSTFSHFDLTHFLINNFVLYSFGPLVFNQIGLTAFSQLFLISAIGCSLAHIFYQKFYDRRPQIAAVGASGVTMGMTLLYAFLRPFEPVLLFLIVPMPVIGAVGAFVAYDLYRAVTHRQGNIGSAGHIGGAIGGTLFYFLKIRSRF